MDEPKLQATLLMGTSLPQLPSHTEAILMDYMLGMALHAKEIVESGEPVRPMAWVFGKRKTLLVPLDWRTPEEKYVVMEALVALAGHFDADAIGLIIDAWMSEANAMEVDAYQNGDLEKTPRTQKSETLTITLRLRKGNRTLVHLKSYDRLPDGKIRWKMERMVPEGEMMSDLLPAWFETQVM